MSTESDEIIGSSHSDDELSLDESSVSSVNINKGTVFEHHIKDLDRYCKDFEEVEILGKGGFGIVSRAKHKLDQKDYAVKRISLSTKSNSDHELVLREVKVMSILNHPNVVRYYNSWIQPKYADNRNLDENELSLYDELTDSYSSSVNSKLSVENSMDSCSITFERDSNESELRLSPYMPEHIVPIPPYRHSLYIQMQLGGDNLRNWIFTRNEKDISDKGLWSLKNAIQHISIFRDIVSGLDYLHLKSITHRDIKPANIVFYPNTNRVFLTDFGLAKITEDSERPNTFHLNNIQSIGSPIYSAPELKMGNCSSKVDIFSLGIVLMEIIYPFSSMSERANILQKLKSNNIIDAKLKKGWHYVVNVILWMTNHDPEKRPEAHTLHKLVVNSFLFFMIKIREKAVSVGQSLKSISLNQMFTHKGRKRQNSLAKCRESKRKGPTFTVRNTKVHGRVVKSRIQNIQKNIRKDVADLKEENKKLTKLVEQLRTENVEIKAEQNELKEMIVNLMCSKRIF